MTLDVSGIWNRLDSKTFKNMENYNDPMKIELLNQAIENRFRPELVNAAPEIYRKEAVITGDGTREIAFPSDMDTTQSPIRMARDENFRNPVLRREYRINGSKFKFDTEIASGTNIYVAYTKKATQFTSVNDPVPESDNSRALSIILNELEALYEYTRAQGLASGRYQSAIQSANRLS